MKMRTAVGIVPTLRIAVSISALALVSFGFVYWASMNAGGAREVHVVRQDNGRVATHLVLPGRGAPPVSMHYIEHLVWLNALRGVRVADRHSNAWTNDMAVGYWLSGGPENLSQLLETLKGVFDLINLPRDFAEQERKIILREYEYRLGGNPDARATVAMDTFLYSGNAIAASVIGTPEEIEALDYDAARALHAGTHVPQSARLVVIGDVSEREVRRALSDAGWPEPDGDRAEITPLPFELAAPDTITLRYPEPDAAPRLIWRRVVALPEPVQFDLLEAQTALLGDILDTNLPGGLVGPMRNDVPIARSFDVQIWPIDEDNIEISFAAEPDKGVSLVEVAATFEATLSHTATDGIPGATYSRVLGRFNGFWPDWQDAEETARWMADYTLDRVSNLREPLSKRDLKRLRDDLSLKATNALLRHLAGHGRTAVGFIGPESGLK